LDHMIFVKAAFLGRPKYAYVDLIHNF